MRWGICKEERCGCGIRTVSLDDRQPSRYTLCGGSGELIGRHREHEHSGEELRFDDYGWNSRIGRLAGELDGDASLRRPVATKDPTVPELI